MRQDGAIKSSEVSRRMNCVIAVCTYRRPVMLLRCLESIGAQDIPAGWDVSVLIIDNDHEGFLPEPVAQWMRSSPLRVEYLLEPRRGIPFARNFACRCSLELGADWLAFIDDDEEALPGWLAAYAMAIGRYDGGVYTGPVRYEMPAEFAGYLQNRGLSRFGDGALLPRAATSNVLLSTRLLLPPWSMQFDTRMAFTGGSDSDFFTRYVFHGGRIVYVNDAQVLEPVIENRLMLSWRLKRQFRSSANRVYTSYKLNGLLRTVVRGAGEILSRFVAGLLRFITLPFCLVSGGLMGLKYAWYHCLRHFAKAFGTLSGLFGIQPRPYWETDGY